MTIHTLRLIHDLLVEEARKTQLTLDTARKKRNIAADKFEYGNGDKLQLSNALTDARVEYEQAYETHRAANAALRDFENHEF